ncbi:hypothetical protein J3F83DRAFT_405648 [Trichoderma novae-zelandiae]
MCLARHFTLRPSRERASYCDFFIFFWTSDSDDDTFVYDTRSSCSSFALSLQSLCPCVNAMTQYDGNHISFCFLGKARLYIQCAQTILHDDTAIVSRRPPFPGESGNVDNSLHHVDVLDTPTFGDHCDRSEERREQQDSVHFRFARKLRLAMMPSHVDNLHTFTTCARHNTHSVSIADGEAEHKPTTIILETDIHSDFGSALLPCLQLLSLSVRTIQPRT